jgi:hypothetical protein
MAQQEPKPKYVSRNLSNIAVSPFSSHIDTIRANAAFARNHLGHMQVYTFSGPGPGTYDAYNPDYDFYEKYGQHSEFPIILHSSPKTDTAQSYRQLAGLLLPWRRVPNWYQGEYCDRPAKISWKHLYNGSTVYHQLYRTTSAWPSNWADVDRFTSLDTSGAIPLYDSHTPSLFVDQDCRHGISGLWVSGNSATLTKDVAYYFSGTQSLKVARNGTNNPYAEGPYSNYEKQMTVGAEYVGSVKALSDGNAVPVVKCGAVTLATGTTDTDWQNLTFSFTATDDVLKFEATTSTGTENCWFDNFQLFELGKFRYETDASGEFTAGILRVERIKVAALSVFTAPDRDFTDAQAVVTQEDIAPGRAIRGYTGTGQGSVGDLMRMVGTGSSYDDDSVERNTRRCLLQSGHPMGLSTSSSSWYNLRSGDESYFKIIPRDLLGKSSGDVSTIPCLYGWCQGASGGNPGYVRYTAQNSGDTWTYEITSDSAGLWNDMTTLDVEATGDFVKIEFKAPTDGWLVCGAYSLWEDSFDV